VDRGRAARHTVQSGTETSNFIVFPMRNGCPSMKPDRLAPDYDLVADAFRD
jgi:hypothetical protein